MNVTMPLDPISVPTACGFYEGYYMAVQNMGVFVVKIGLAFFVFDFVAKFLNSLLYDYLDRRKK